MRVKKSSVLEHQDVMDNLYMKMETIVRTPLVSGILQRQLRGTAYTMGREMSPLPVPG